MYNCVFVCFCKNIVQLEDWINFLLLLLYKTKKYTDLIVRIQTLDTNVKVLRLVDVNLTPSFFHSSILRKSRLDTVPYRVVSLLEKQIFKK